MLENAPVAGNVLIPLMLAHVIASLVVVETRRLKSAIMALVVQSALLAAIIGVFAFTSGNATLYWWVGVCVITKVLLVPVLLWRYCAVLPEREPEPVLSFWTSIALLSIAVVVIYQVVQGYADVIIPSVSAAAARDGVAVAFVVMALGLYTATVRRGTIKIILGLLLMENGVHLTLLSLAPAYPTTTVIGVATNVIALVWLMLYLAAQVYEILGTTDMTELSELRR